MGNDPPQPQPQQQQQPKPVPVEEEEDIYILENLTTLSLKSENRPMHFWIDPKIFSGENQKYENFFRQVLDLEGFSSLEGFLNEIASVDTTKKIKVICAASLQEEQYKKLQEDPRIYRMYLFCQNQERAKLLMSNFPKIKTAKYDAVKLRQTLVDEQSSGDGVDPKVNLLFTIEEDTNLMNKYRINFHSLTNCKAKLNAKADFINFAKKIFPSKMTEIEEFSQNYKLNSTQSARQTLYWLGKPGFFWESTQALPKITTDPKKLAYLRFIFKQSYQGILKQYREHPKHLAEVFVVITPTEQQLEKLKNNLNNYLIFTSFMKGYTVEKLARKVAKKNPHSLLVRVMTKLSPKICEELDFGYCLFETTEEEEPNVVFNIYNVFQVLDLEEQNKQLTLQYGSLAEVAYIRQKERTTRLGPFQQNLIRNYDYLQDIISRIDSQATILQMSGHFEDSLLIHSQKLQQIRKSQPSQEVLDKHAIDLGDAYRINEEYTKAQQQYLSVKEGKMGLIANVHLAELYFKTKESAKLQNVIVELEKNIAKYKQISQPDSFKAQNYIGIELINRGKYKQASKLYKTLSSQINAYYNFKFQGIPLVHEIHRNRALCETKLNNFSEALNLLDSTKSWQRICEGNKSPGLIITQNLIKSVHQSRGDSDQALECDQEVNKIRQSLSTQDNAYLSRNSVMPLDLNQSLVCLQISNFTQQNANGSGQRSAIEQSAINIQL